MTRIATPSRPHSPLSGTPDPADLSLDAWAALLSLGHFRLKGLEPLVRAPLTVFGRGIYHVQRLRPGLMICSYDMTYGCNATVRIARRPHACLGMLLEGRHEGTVAGLPFDLRRGGVPSLFASSRDLEAVVHVHKGEKCRAVGVCIDDEFFDSLQTGSDDTAFAALRRLMREPLIVREFEHAVALQYHLQDLANCPYTGVMACLHCESRALAILVELASCLKPTGPARGHSLRKGRQERVHHVRHLLDSNLDKPLSLAEIARRVGSNETTLRLDFKAVMGTTIFAYVRDRRLDLARKLVRDGELPLASIAYITGYASPANFSTAYRKRFGIAPSAECRHAHCSKA